MTEVVSVKFKDTGKAYYFSPDGKTVNVGDKVIVETQNGNELGVIYESNHSVEDETLVLPLKKMLRTATEKDLKLKYRYIRDTYKFLDEFNPNWTKNIYFDIKKRKNKIFKTKIFWFIRPVLKKIINVLKQINKIIFNI